MAESTWFRWSIRLLAIAVIAVGAWILYVASPVTTAGNVGIWFISDLEDDSQGLEDAFGRLCSDERQRIGLDQFVESGGAEYAVLANAGAVGADKQYPEPETLDGDLKEAWVEYEIEAGETWRLYLVMERDWWELGGEWKVCGVEIRDG